MAPEIIMTDILNSSVTLMLYKFASPLWTGGLMLSNIKDIEKVQKTGFKAIPKENYLNYKNYLVVSQIYVT